jgi:hypothetical protein
MILTGGTEAQLLPRLFPAQRCPGSDRSRTSIYEHFNK